MSTSAEFLEKLRRGEINADAVTVTENEPPVLKGFRTKITGWFMALPPGVIAIIYGLLDVAGVDPQVLIDMIAELWRFIVAVYAAGGVLVNKYRNEA